MIVTASGDVTTTAAPSGSEHVLRWTFRRDGEAIVCELALTGDHTAYQLRLNPPWNPAGIGMETFDDAVSAFERQGVVERLLVADGWSLERFDALKPAR